MLKGGGAVRPSFIQTIAGIPGHNIVSLPCSSNLATNCCQVMSGYVTNYTTTSLVDHAAYYDADTGGAYGGQLPRRCAF